MKKIGLFAMTAAFGLFASCNKEADHVASVVTESKGTEVLLTVKDEVWTDDGTKTAYYPAESKVRLTGDEMISLYYPNGESDNKIVLGGNIKASPTGVSGQYSFTIPDTPSGLTHWYGLLPYSSIVNGFNTGNTSVVLRLGPVQFPGANTFDPHCDFLLAKPFDVTGTPGSASGEISSFKRIFAPLCISVSGLESGDKVYAATVKFSQEPTASSALAGVFYLSFTGDGYADNSISGNATNAGNALSVVYADGLAAVNGRWPIWLMVNPITLTAGSGETLTLSISTADKTYTRTVTLPKEVSISNEQLNQIKFNIKGEGYTVAESVTQDFTEQTLTGNQTLTASDGGSLTWVSSITKTFTSAVDDNGSGITSAMYANQSFTFPTIPGKRITGARIFCHPASRYGGTSAVSVLTVNGTDTYNYNLSTWTANNGMCYKGGALDIGLPDGCTSLSGVSVVPTNQQNLISAITLFTEDDPAFANDYYAQYEAGRDITINGTVFNKATNGAARLVKLYKMANANELIKDYSTEGILFLDYDSTDPEISSADDDVYTNSSAHLYPNNVVIIGRYRDHQPHLDMTSKMFSPSGTKFYLKNIKITTSAFMFSTNNTSTLDISCEDCTLESSSNHVFCESYKGHSFGEIIINNCVIKVTNYLYSYQIGGTNQWVDNDSNSSVSKLWLTNNVIYSSTNARLIATYIGSSSKVYTPNLDIKLDHNTFYSIYNQYSPVPLVSIASVAKLNFSYCVGEASLIDGKNGVLVDLPAALSPQITDSAISNNYFNDSGSTSAIWIYGYSRVPNSGINVSSGNTYANGTSPFTSTNTTTGYFPVNTTVVTNGAGASYETKLWKTW